MDKATPTYDPQDERYEEEAAYVAQVARRQARQEAWVNRIKQTRGSRSAMMADNSAIENF